MSGCYSGIDVGTGSARAGIFDPSGRLLGSSSHAIQIWHPEPDFAEQSSEDIWRACAMATKMAMKIAGVKPDDIRGVGFDATCSLVALEKDDKPISISPTGRGEQNIIVWMDHRAIEQAEIINKSKAAVLKYVGGTISPEMQTPKLKWLKEKMPKTWRQTTKFLDLPDFLTYRATGVDVRSLCTTVCKWTYMGHFDSDTAGSIGRWDDSYFKTVRLNDLALQGFSRIGTKIRPMGEPVGKGLTKRSAKELGLKEGTAVGVAIIDAHAGGLGMLGAAINGINASTRNFFERRLALIGGTSSCFMAVSKEPIFVPGVWGPYFSAMIPGMWLTEGGQSATGALIDHVISSHSQAENLAKEAKSAGKSIYDVLNNRLDALAKDMDIPAALTRDLHVLPYHHGNRSPRADPTLRGVVAGMKLGDTSDDLAVLYLATIQAIAHGARHIIETMNENGYKIDTIFACGGGTKNRIFLREHADITGCPIILPAEPEAVLLGSSILGAVASGDFATVPDAMAAMNKAGDVIEPAGGKVAQYHDLKNRVFHRMYKDFIAYRRIMNE